MQEIWTLDRKRRDTGVLMPMEDCWCSYGGVYLPHIGTQANLEALAQGYNSNFYLKDTYSYEARPLTGDEWKMRGMARFYLGHWEAPYWLDQFHWYAAWEGRHVHFPHVAKMDPSKIAFIEDEDKGKADRITVMKPGRFLTKFFSDVLTPEQIGELANQYIAKSKPGVLHFARTADEIEHVYTNGPSSCMSYEAHHFDSPVHPARVYASPDLAVAYIDRGGITARAVVWPEKKIFSRTYGDSERLKNALAEQGYTEGYLDGARLVRIEYQGAFVCPYLDKTGDFYDDGDFLRIGGDIDAQNTNGLSGDDRASRCDRCEDRIPEGEGYYVHAGRHDEEYWCESCEANHSVHCEHEEITVSDGSAVQLADETYASEWYFDRRGFVCEGDGENYLRDDLVELEDGTMWSQGYFDDNGATCGVTFKNYAIEDMVCHPEFDWVHKDTPEGQAILAAADDTGTASVLSADLEVA